MEGHQHDLHRRLDRKSGHLLRLAEEQQNARRGPCFTQSAKREGPTRPVEEGQMGPRQGMTLP
jgi:hypothetical protein